MQITPALSQGQLNVSINDQHIPQPMSSSYTPVEFRPAPPRKEFCQGCARRVPVFRDSSSTLCSDCGQVLHDFGNMKNVD